MPDDIRDPSVDWDNVDYVAISDFFERKGAVELIAFLDGIGFRFDEIDNALDVSRGYINDRRDEALNLNLIYPDRDTRDGSIRRVWALTPLGLCIKHQLKHFSVVESHSRLISDREQYNRKKNRFRQWAHDPENIKTTAENLKKKKDNWASDLSPEARESLSESDRKRF